MTTKWSQFIATLIILLAISGVSCSKDTSGDAPAKIEKKIVKVNTMVVTVDIFEQRLTLTASTKADRSVIIASATAGRIVRLGFEKGMDVTIGQPLVWLDDSVLVAERDQAHADRDMAALDYKKMKALSDKNANISELTLEQALLRLKASKARVAALKARMDMLVIKAPFTGVAVTRDMEVGAFISPGQRLAKVVTKSPMKVLIGVPETAIADFTFGKPATVILDAYKGQSFNAKVSYISPEVNPSTRVFDCELIIDGGSVSIRPEMSAKVSFSQKTLQDSILIPQTSVVELVDGHAVYIVVEGAAKLRRIEIIDSADDKALVKSGLAVGEQLVISGQRSLIDGDTVEVAN